MQTALHNDTHANYKMDHDVSRLRIDGGAIYSQPNRPTHSLDGAYVNPAVLYEDANPPKIPLRTYSMSNIDGITTTTDRGDFYETIEKTLSIDNSGTNTPNSVRSATTPHFDRSSALAALDGATAGEDEAMSSAPRSLLEQQDNVYMVTGDSHTAIVQLPGNHALLSDGVPTYSYRYKTYSHEPLADAREIEYTFPTSARL